MVKKSLFYITTIILIFLFFYLKTLAPGNSFHDAGELQTAICTLGIVHPPGYPAYIILGKIFTLLLPFGSIAWRVNFMSAFFSIITLILFFLINKKILKSSLAAFITTLILGFSNNYWKFSLVAEMYSLNDFFMLLFLYFIFFILAKAKKNVLLKFYLFFFLLGLAQGNHRNITIITPILVIYLFTQTPQIFIKNIKKTLALALFFILGLSIYLYLPLRSRQNPYLNYAHPVTWKNFKYLVTAQQFKFLMFTVPFKKLISERLSYFGQLLQDQFFWPGIILSILGIFWYLYKKRYQSLVLFILIFLTNSFIWLNYNTADIYRYLNSSFIMVAFFIAAGINVFYLLAKKMKKLAFLTIVLLNFLFLSFPFYLAKKNYSNVDQSKDFGAYHWGTAVMKTLKPRAVIISHWGYSPALWYLQGCLHFRPDVIIADDRTILDNGWQSRVNTVKLFLNKRPVYIINYRPYNQELEHAGYKLIEKCGIFKVK